MDIATPAQALWNQRQVLAGKAERLRGMIDIVGRPGDFTPFQWAQATAFALDFAPDLIVELGRAFGNSTCCFLEAAHELRRQPPCQVVSVCLNNHWHSVTAPRLQAVCSPDWFANGRIVQGDILDYDFIPLLEKSERCLIFWDAHGFDIAECVLGRMLPMLANKPHAVMMHDMTDLRYCTPPREYGDQGLWKGENGVNEKFWMGHISSSVSQAISIVDFAIRNRMPLHSADESLHAEFANDTNRREAVQQLLGKDLFSLEGHWFWFTLNQAPEPYTFPHFDPQQAKARKSQSQNTHATGNPLTRLLQAIVPKSF
jgi:hypothetical protein